MARTRRRARFTALALSLALAGCSAGAAGVNEATSQTGASVTDGDDSDVSGLYDDSVVHDIEVTVDPDDYDELIAAYQGSSEKIWIEATVVVDGETYHQVGLRLKGNSSLSGLGGGGQIRNVLQVDAGDAPIATGTNGEECTIAIPGIEPGIETDGDATTGGAVAENPEALPWLIRLDKYVEDQEHDGVTEFVVRSNNSETALNEAVALELLAAAGLATQDATAARFTVNDSDPALRLVIENPNDEWVVDQFDESGSEAIGQLYKAESTGDWDYHGDDPTAYEEVWDQEAGEDDLTPLTEFLAFVNDSTDEEFAAELADRLDVEAFARYLAIEDLMDNFDDIEGPGNNAYLYFDPDTGVATVVAWDHNLAFSVGMGGMGGGGPVGAPGGRFPSGEMIELPEGCELPADFEPGARPGGAGGNGGDGGFPQMMNGSNILVERFNEVAEFAALYDAAVEELTAELFADGTADELLTQWADMLTDQAADLVSADTIEAEAQQVRDAFPGE
ncbi:MAG: CotH kinase family protein [Actinomycetota bacterium]|nr:CotH kinase family protein [Actinomycetota bacterium]